MTIARSLYVEPNPEDRLLGSERLYKATFKRMKFYNFEVGHLCWIYPENWLLPLSNAERITLLYRANLVWFRADVDIVLPAPPLPPTTYHDSPSFSS